jgi:hypothetical protein
MTETRASDATRVIVLIKESVRHVACNRLFFHLGAQIDGNATTSWFYLSQSGPGSLQKVLAVAAVACNLLTE